VVRAFLPVPYPWGEIKKDEKIKVEAEFTKIVYPYFTTFPSMGAQYILHACTCFQANEL
jgi:hypothetical protein